VVIRNPAGLGLGLVGYGLDLGLVGCGLGLSLVGCGLGLVSSVLDLGGSDLDNITALVLLGYYYH
jgi:hypothetical protein